MTVRCDVVDPIEPTIHRQYDCIGEIVEVDELCRNILFSHPSTHTRRQRAHEARRSVLSHRRYGTKYGHRSIGASSTPVVDQLFDGCQLPGECESEIGAKCSLFRQRYRIVRPRSVHESRRQQDDVTRGVHIGQCQQLRSTRDCARGPSDQCIMVARGQVDDHIDLVGSRVDRRQIAHREPGAINTQSFDHSTSERKSRTGDCNSNRSSGVRCPRCDRDAISECVRRGCRDRHDVTIQVFPIQVFPRLAPRRTRFGSIFWQ